MDEDSAKKAMTILCGIILVAFIFGMMTQAAMANIALMM